MPAHVNWSYPTTIRFGAGRIAEIAAACKDAGITKPLLVTDRGLAELEITARTLDYLEAAGMGRAMFAEVDPNPTDENLAAGIEVFKSGGHDGVLAFGGGSGLDLAKMVAFMAGQTRPVWDFEDIGDYWIRADADAIFPNVAVPTTAGTGSEVGRASVVTNTAVNEKKVIFHPKVLPSVVIMDPELTVGMPPAITAGTGMDAFAHCLEAYCSPHYHPMSQGIALEGLRLVTENLPLAYAEPGNLEARGNMMSAAMMGAVAFQKGLGAIHALSHPIGAMHHTHHGTTNAVVMQTVLDFNRPAIEDRMDRLAAFLKLQGGFDAVRGLVGELNARLGIPRNLTELGVTDIDPKAWLDGALKDPTTGGNPIEMTRDNTADLIDRVLALG